MQYTGLGFHVYWMNDSLRVRDLMTRELLSIPVVLEHLCRNRHSIVGDGNTGVLGRMRAHDAIVEIVRQHYFVEWTDSYLE